MSDTKASREVSFPPLAPSLNRTQELTRRLAADIRSGQLQPGSRLPTEQELATRTGVSRTVVREAVAALRADGLVRTRQGLGAFVTANFEQGPFRIDVAKLASSHDVVRVLELRMSIEIEASGLAAERRKAADLAKITAAFREIDDEIGRGGNAIDADFRFHLSIFQAAQNRYFPEFLQFLGHIIIPRQRGNVSSESDTQRRRYLARIQAEHLAMLEAIRLGDPTAARRAARRHLGNALRRYEEIGLRIAGRGEVAG